MEGEELISELELGGSGRSRRDTEDLHDLLNSHAE
jgi:hypothetical protein